MEKFSFNSQEKMNKQRDIEKKIDYTHSVIEKRVEKLYKHINDFPMFMKITPGQLMIEIKDKLREISKKSYKDKKALKDIEKIDSWFKHKEELLERYLINKEFQQTYTTLSQYADLSAKFTEKTPEDFKEWLNEWNERAKKANAQLENYHSSPADSKRPGKVFMELNKCKEALRKTKESLDKYLSNPVIEANLDEMEYIFGQKNIESQQKLKSDIDTVQPYGDSLEINNDLKRKRYKLDDDTFKSIYQRASRMLGSFVKELPHTKNIVLGYIEEIEKIRVLKYIDVEYIKRIKKIDNILRKLEDRRNNYKLTEKCRQLHEMLSQYADLYGKFANCAPEQFQERLDQSLEKSKQATAWLDAYLEGNNLIDPNAWFEDLKESRESFEKEKMNLNKYLLKWFKNAYKEFTQSKNQLQEEAQPLSFVNMSQFTGSLHENQKKCDQAIQQMRDYFSGNENIDIRQVFQKISHANNELRIKRSFLDSQSFLKINKINGEINAISKEFIELQKYFVQPEQNTFVERLDAIRNKRLVANENFSQYFLKNYQLTNHNYAEEMEKISAQSKIDPAASVSAPEVNAGEGPSRPKTKGQAKDLYELSDQLIEQIVVAPPKGQFDSEVLGKLQETFRDYEALKGEWAPLLDQIQKNKPSAEVEGFIQAWVQLQQEQKALQPVFAEANKYYGSDRQRIDNLKDFSAVKDLTDSLEQAEKEIKSAQEALKDPTKSASELSEQTKKLTAMKDALPKGSLECKAFIQAYSNLNDGVKIAHCNKQKVDLQLKIYGTIYRSFLKFRPSETPEVLATMESTYRDARQTLIEAKELLEKSIGANTSDLAQKSLTLSDANKKLSERLEIFKSYLDKQVISHFESFSRTYTKAIQLWNTYRERIREESLLEYGKIESTLNEIAAKVQPSDYFKASQAPSVLNPNSLGIDSQTIPSSMTKLHQAIHRDLQGTIKEIQQLDSNSFINSSNAIKICEGSVDTTNSKLEQIANDRKKTIMIEQKLRNFEAHFRSEEIKSTYQLVTKFLNKNAANVRNSFSDIENELMKNTISNIESKYIKSKPSGNNQLKISDVTTDYKRISEIWGKLKPLEARLSFLELRDFYNSLPSSKPSSDASSMPTAFTKEDFWSAIEGSEQNIIKSFPNVGVMSDAKILEISEKFIKKLTKKLQSEIINYSEEKYNGFNNDINTFKEHNLEGYNLNKNIDNTNTVKKFQDWWNSHGLVLRENAQKYLEPNIVPIDTSSESITQLKDMSDMIQQLKSLHEKNFLNESQKVEKLMERMKKCAESYEEDSQSLGKVPNIKDLRKLFIDLIEFGDEKAIEKVGKYLPDRSHFPRNEALPKDVPDEDLLVVKAAQGMHQLWKSQNMKSNYTEDTFEEYARATKITYHGSGKFSMEKDHPDCKYLMMIHIHEGNVRFEFSTRPEGKGLPFSDLWWGDYKLLLSTLKSNQASRQMAMKDLELARKDNMQAHLETLGIKNAFGLKNTIHQRSTNRETRDTWMLLRKMFKNEIFTNEKNHETYPAFLAMLSTHISYRALFSTAQHFTDLKILKIGKLEKSLVDENSEIKESDVQITFGIK